MCCPTYTTIQELPGDEYLPIRPTRCESKELVTGAILCLVLGHVVRITSQVIQHGEICQAGMVDLTLSGLKTRGFLLSFVDGKREHQVRLPPDTVNHETAVRIVHHVAQPILRESRIGLLVLLFAIFNTTDKAVVEVPLVKGLETQCRIRNSRFHFAISIVVLLHILIWSLVPVVSYRSVIIARKPEFSSGVTKPEIHSEHMVIHNQAKDIIPSAHLPAELGGIVQPVVDSFFRQSVCPLVKLRFLLFAQRFPVF